MLLDNHQLNSLKSASLPKHTYFFHNRPEQTAALTHAYSGGVPSCMIMAQQLYSSQFTLQHMQYKNFAYEV